MRDDRFCPAGGFVAAHAILCVSRGQSLTMPLVVFEKDDGSPQFVEVKGASSQEAVERAGRILAEPAADTLRAVLAFAASEGRGEFEVRSAFSFSSPSAWLSDRCDKKRAALPFEKVGPLRSSCLSDQRCATWKPDSYARSAGYTAR